MVLNISDEEYRKVGCHIVDQNEVLKQDIICNPKIGDEEYLKDLNNQTVFGWVHAVQNRDICDNVVNGANTAYAWEDMFENGVHSFYRNNQLAGQVAVLHAFLNHGSLPSGKKVAVLGNGNTSKGAQLSLRSLGADVKVYDKDDEEKFRTEMFEFDAIVNCILWDTKRVDHIIYNRDLKKLKRDCLIVDVSCDRCGGIESSIPTLLTDPIYVVDGVTHYCVDHTPTLVHKEASYSISKVVSKYIDLLVEGKEDEVLSKCKIIEHGKIIDQKIINYQKRG